MTVSETSTEVVIEKDVVFGHAGGRDLLCDLYLPPADISKHLALVHIHGGGGNRGSKEGARLAKSMALLGYVGVAMQYRLAGEALWPAQIYDVKACIRWTRANADRLNVSAQNVGLLGYSFGGQLAFIASGSPNRPDMEGESGTSGVSTEVAACIALYPSGRDDTGSRTVAGPDAAEPLKDLDPIEYIGAGFPPSLLMHGTADTVVNVNSSFGFYQALLAAGGPAELHVIEGVNHSFEDNEEFAKPSAAFIDLFLDRHLVTPRSYRERRR